jgi:hypothetical protein
MHYIARILCAADIDNERWHARIKKGSEVNQQHVMRETVTESFGPARAL